MYGVVDGVYFCNQDKLEKMNEKILNRNIPSQNLKPEYSPRPVSTKYAILPIVDRVPLPDVPLDKYKPFSVETVFNPGTAQAPWAGFAQNINIDSTLRNQFFALQKSPEAVYIPSSSSSLYVSPLAAHTYLKNNFSQLDFSNTKSRPELDIIGNNTFNNSTRCQRMNLNMENLC